jgi:DNA-3-methyladenine glycosylase II
MERIDSPADLELTLGALLESDPRLKLLAAVAGPVPLRRRPGGFVGLGEIITAQQISSIAAQSIWSRLELAIEPFTPQVFLAASAETLRTAGLSRPKIRILTGVASACAGGLDLDGLARMPAADAVRALTAFHGIGSWTAEIYLLFCLGHADIFPAGDLALQVAAQNGLGLPRRPTEKELRAVSADWAPWRGAAASLLWAYYRTLRGAARPASASAAA